MTINSRIISTIFKKVEEYSVKIFVINFSSITTKGKK